MVIMVKNVIGNIKLKMMIIIFIIASLAFVGTELLLRNRVFNKNIYIDNSSITSLVLYTTVIGGDGSQTNSPLEPHKQAKFKFYGDIGHMLYKSDIKLNNMGYFSRNDYNLNREKNEFRILVIGGEQTASTVVNVSWPDYLMEYLNKKTNTNGDTVYKVYNIGFPDAGPDKYLTYWQMQGKKFKPDLVVINMCETDFYRSYSSMISIKTSKSPHKMRGVTPTGHSSIYYSPKHGNGEVAKTNVLTFPGMKEISLRDPWVMVGRPVGYFVSDKLIENDLALRDLQLKTAEDLVYGALPPFGGMVIRLLSGKSTNIDVHTVRNFDQVSQAPMDKDDIIKCGTKSFSKLVNEIPNLILIHNFNYPEVAQKMDYEFSRAMVAKEPRIKVVDMRERLKKPIKEEEMKSWFMVPKMAEKWTEKGHQMYAKLNADLVMEWINKRGKTNKLSGIMKLSKEGEIK
jgi:hypothetical protein